MTVFNPEFSADIGNFAVTRQSLAPKEVYLHPNGEPRFLKRDVFLTCSHMSSFALFWAEQ